MDTAPIENPPSYERATGDNNVNVDNKQADGKVTDNKPSASQMPAPGISLPYSGGAGPSYSAHPNPAVYHYVNPTTQEHVTSLLPPDHPEMVCLQAGGHVAKTQFGILGILAAVVWFPLGVGLCLLDRRVKCARCGQTIDEGCFA